MFIGLRIPVFLKGEEVQEEIECPIENTPANSAIANQYNLKICSECGTVQNKEFKFCKNCGTLLSQDNKVSEHVKKDITSSDDIKTRSSSAAELRDEKFCPVCGSKISANDNFCMNCGNPTT